MKDMIRRKIRQIKDRFRDAMENMAKENRRQFGSGGLDCCDLNKEKKPNAGR